jgi:cell division transport system permease protein
MFKKIRQMNTEITELIQKNTTYYTLSFTTLIFAFLFFNISLISIYNLYQNNKILNNSYNLSVYINNNVSQNSIEKIEKSILEIDGVEGISYIDKKIALKKLTEKLGITNHGMTNPLLNSFNITTSGEGNLKNAKVVIDEIDGVKEVIINEKNTTTLDKKIVQNKKLMIWLFFITLIPIMIMKFNIMHSTVVSQSHDIEAKLYLGLEKKEILRPYYFINNIKFISAGIIGSLIFLNLYEFLRRSLSEFIYLVPFFKVGVIVGIIMILIGLIFPLISFNLIKVKR